jgi:4-hydroxy-tetrahydrodipicolinate synthase
MTGKTFRGATVALVTPFDQTGAVDEKALRALVDWQVTEGMGALLATGTTGESVTLTSEEQLRVIEIVIEQAGGRCPVIAGTGSNSTEKSIHATEQAEKLGADAILLVGPYYNKPTQEGFYQHFKSIAESTRLPVILYNVPGRTGSNISAETTLRLSGLPNVAGVKEASGNFSQIMQIIRERPADFVVLSGDDAVTLPLVALGGDGVISVVANAVPGPFSKMVRAALDGRWEEARQLHYRLLPLMDLCFIESNPIPVKAALAMMGRIQEVYRLPLVPIGEANRLKLQRGLAELGLVG